MMKKDGKLPEDVVIPDLMGQTANRALKKPFKYVAGVYQKWSATDGRRLGYAFGLVARARARGRTTASNATKPMDRREF